MGTPSWQNIHNTRYETTSHISYVEAKRCIDHSLGIILIGNKNVKISVILQYEIAK